MEETASAPVGPDGNHGGIPPRRTLRPLSVALAGALAFAVGGFLAARGVHPSATGGAVRPSPSAHPTVRASATPQAVSFAPLFGGDDLSVRGARAYGRLSLVGTDNTLVVGRYVLGAVADPGVPATAPVWRADRSSAVDASSLGARFGMPGAPSSGPDGALDWGGLDYEPAGGILSYSGGTAPDAGARPRLAAVPTDATVAALATDFLTRRGLLMDGLGQPRVYPLSAQSARPHLEAWTLDWDRSIDGRPLSGTGRGISMSVGSQGAVSSLLVSMLRIDGGSAYPLISWRQAWSHVAAGHWYAERGGFSGGNAPSRVDTFTAASVQLGYLSQERPVAQLSATERDYLVPMWVFSDSSGLQLFYPAVAAGALSYSWQPRPWPSGQY